MYTPRLVPATVSILCILAASIRPTLGSEPAKPGTPGPAASRDRYLERLERFRAENAALGQYFPGQRTVVLLGSSSVEGFCRGEGRLPGWFVLDRGISGDRIGIGDRGIRRRLAESAFDCNPAHVFLQNGTNDLAYTVRDGSPTVDRIAAVCREVVGEILARVPGVSVHIVSCFPTRDRYANLAPLTPQLNAEYRAIADELDRVDYVDLYSQLVGADDLIRPEYSADGLHINAAGYELWAAAMSEILCSP